MLEVRVMGLGKGAIPIEKGRIYYDGNLHPSNDSYLLKEILANEIYTEKGKKLRAGEDPEAFFRGLSGHYRSAYLRVTSPKEVNPQNSKSLPGAPAPPEHPVGSTFSTIAKDGSTWWFRVDADTTRRIPNPNKPPDEINPPKVGESPAATGQNQAQTTEGAPENWEGHLDELAGSQEDMREPGDYDPYEEEPESDDASDWGSVGGSDDPTIDVTNPSLQKVGVKVTTTEGSGEIQQYLFKKKLEPEEMYRLSGGVPGLTCSISDFMGSHLQVVGRTDLGSNITAQIGRAEATGRVYAVVGVRMNGEDRGTTMGPKILGNSLKTMKDLGVQLVECSACRDDERQTIGYKVWPKMGFDGPIGTQREKLPEQYRSAKTIQELYAMPGGRKAWEEHGNTIDLSLDLTGEASTRVLSLIEKMGARGQKSLDNPEVTQDELMRALEESYQLLEEKQKAQKANQPVDKQETPKDELADKEEGQTQKASSSSSKEQLDRRARLIADILGNTLIPAEIDQILDSAAKPKKSQNKALPPQQQQGPKHPIGQVFQTRNPEICMVTRPDPTGQNQTQTVRASCDPSRQQVSNSRVNQSPFKQRGQASDTPSNFDQWAEQVNPSELGVARDSAEGTSTNTSYAEKIGRAILEKFPDVESFNREESYIPGNEDQYEDLLKTGMSEQEMDQGLRWIESNRKGEQHSNSEFEEEQKRKFEYDPELPQQTISKLAAGMESNPNLSDEQKQRYLASSQKVIDRMPLKALKTLNNTLTMGVYFGESSEAMFENLIGFVEGNSEIDPHLAKIYSEDLRANAKFGGGAIGWANEKVGLWLDGPRTKEGLEMMEKMGATGRAIEEYQIYAHEFSHALDGPKYPKSSHPAWQKAWHDEIVSTGNLTEYAENTYYEGWAEFGRLLYSGDHDLKKVKEDYPQCWDIWDKCGFIPPQAEGMNQDKLPEIFSHSIPTPDNGHVDIIRPSVDTTKK